MFKIEKILADGLLVYLSTYLRNNHRIVFCFTNGNGGHSNYGVVVII